MKIYSALYNDFAHLKPLGTTKVVYYPEQLDEPGILILHGGADISPSIYGEIPNSYTCAETTPSDRDRTEIELIRTAISKGIFLYGICRGAQLLTAMAGGTLVQHVTNHGGTHDITTKDGKTFQVNSAHHQMCNPFKIEHDLLGWTTKPRSFFYIGENEHHLDMPCEPEVIYYPKMKALAVQCHPEWMSKDNPFISYVTQLITERM